MPPARQPAAPGSELLQELENCGDKELLALVGVAEPTELMAVINLSPSSSPLRGRLLSLAPHLIPVAAGGLNLDEIRLLWEGVKRSRDGQAG